MISIKNCPICGGENFQKKLRCKDHSVSKKTFTIVSCETCSFLITNPRPEENEIGAYYQNSSYISHHNNTKGLFNFLYQAVRKYTTIKKTLLLKHKKGDSVLDIGCGTGEFLNKCEKLGITTKGVEPAEIARKQATKKFGLEVSKKTDLKEYKNNEFNHITLWHALEHIAKLEETIQELARILKKEGQIIVAVPNYKCWDAKHYKEYWAAWDTPIHFWHFSKKTISMLFKNHGFSLVKTSPMIFDSYYVSILSEKYRSGKRNFIRGIIVGLISNIFGILTKNGHSSTIYIFKKKK